MTESVRPLRFGLSATFICFSLVLIYRGFRGFPPSKANINLASLSGLLLVGSFCLFRSKEIGSHAATGSPPVFLPALVILPFLITVSAPFLFDSYSHVVTASTESLSQVLRTAYAHPTGGDFFFRPLGYFDYWIDAKWAGSSPLFWHSSNLLFHLVAVYLLFLLARQLGLSPWACVLSAIVFGLHPTGPEVVSWVAARFDQLATCFVLLTLVFFCALADGKRTFPLMIAACLCALLSKEAAFCLPGLAICCLWYRGRFARRDLKAVAALVITCALVFIYRSWVLGGIGGYKDTSGIPTVLQVSIPRTLELLLFRMWGVLLVPINWARSLSIWLLLVWLLFAITASVAMLVSKPEVRRIFASVSFAIVSLLPVTHLALLDAKLTGSRVFHLAVIGFALLVAAIYDGFPVKKTAAFFVSTILLFEGAALIHNLLTWRDTAYLAARTCSAFPAMLDGYNGPVTVYLPSTHNGVFFLSNGFADCVYLNTGRHITITQMQRDSDTPAFTWDESSESLKKIR
jgi:hypothetical protein